MKSSETNPLRTGLLWAGVLVLLWGPLIHQLGAQWSTNEQYSYGWSVPVLAAYLFWRAWQRRPAAVPPNAAGPVLVLAGLAALFLLPVRWLHEANPIWRLTSLLWSLEAVGLSLVGVYLAGGFPWLRRFAFPVAFFLVAVPWPSAIENGVTQSLQKLVVAAVVELVGLAGVPALAAGTVIQIGAGAVGIDEACSGIRSLQASLMISLFFGELYQLRPWRRVGLCLGGFLLSLVFNLARTLVLTSVALKTGAQGLSQWHNPAGIGILVGCFVSLWLVALLLVRRQESSPQAGDGAKDGVSESPCPGTGHSWPRSPQGSVVCLGLWLLGIEIGVELWYRAHEGSVVSGPAWTVAWPEADASFKKAPISVTTMGILRADEGGGGVWMEPSGLRCQVFYFRWAAARSVANRVRVHAAQRHRPDNCLSAAGMRLRSEGKAEVWRLGSGLELPFQEYQFAAGQRMLYVFFCLKEDGGDSNRSINVRSTARDRVTAALEGRRNLGLRSLEIAVWGATEPQARTSARQVAEQLVRRS